MYEEVVLAALTGSRDFRGMAFWSFVCGPVCAGVFLHRERKTRREWSSPCSVVVNSLAVLQNIR